MGMKTLDDMRDADLKAELRLETTDVDTRLYIIGLLRERAKKQVDAIMRDHGLIWELTSDELRDLMPHADQPTQDAMLTVIWKRDAEAVKLTLSRSWETGKTKITRECHIPPDQRSRTEKGRSTRMGYQCAC